MINETAIRARYAAIKDQLDERGVREGLEGNLCRCTGYHNIVKAVLACAGDRGALTESSS